MEGEGIAIPDEEIHKLTAPAEQFLQSLTEDHRRVVEPAIQIFKSDLEQGFVEEIASKPDLFEPLQQLFQLIDIETETHKRQVETWNSETLPEKIKALPEIVNTGLKLKVMKLVVDRFMAQARDNTVLKLAGVVPLSPNQSRDFLDIIMKADPMKTHQENR